MCLKIFQHFFIQNAEFVYFEGQKRHIWALFLGISLLYQCSNPVRLGPLKNCNMVIFRIIDEKQSQNMCHTTQTRNFLFDFFYLVTMDELDLKYAHRKLRMVL